MQPETSKDRDGARITVFSMNMLCADYVKNSKYDVDFSVEPAVLKGDRSQLVPMDQPTFNAYLEAYAAATPHRMAATVGFYGPSIRSADILTFQEVSDVEWLASRVEPLGFELVSQQRKAPGKRGRPKDFACIFGRPQLRLKPRPLSDFISESDWLDLNSGKPIAAAHSEELDISVLSVHCNHGKTKQVLTQLTDNDGDLLIVGDFNETVEGLEGWLESEGSYGKSPTMRCLEGRHPETYGRRIDQVLGRGRVSVVSTDAVQTDLGEFNFVKAMLFGALSDHIPILAEIRVLP